MDWIVVFVAVFVCFALGVCIGMFIMSERFSAVKVVEHVKQTAAVEEIKDGMKEREQLKKEQEAFKELMGYNTTIAYGMEVDTT